LGNSILNRWLRRPKGFELAVLFLGVRIAHIHFLVHKREKRALRADHGELKHVAILGAVGGGFAAFGEALAASFLHAAIHYDEVPAIKEAGVVKKAPLPQVTEHKHWDLCHALWVYPAGVVGGIVRASDGGLALKARVLGRLATQQSHVPSRFAGLALLVKGVARTLAREEGADDLPPYMSGGIQAHVLDAQVRQRVEPSVEPGKG